MLIMQKPLYEETVRALIFKLCREKRYFVMITLFAKDWCGNLLLSFIFWMAGVIGCLLLS